VKTRSTSLRATSLLTVRLSSLHGVKTAFCGVYKYRYYASAEEQMSQPVLVVGTLWYPCRLEAPSGGSDVCYLRQTGKAVGEHLRRAVTQHTREATSERHSPLSVRRSLLDSRVVSLFALLIPSISTLHHICCQKSSPYVLQRIAAKITESPLLREVVFGSGQWPNLIHH